MTATPAMCQYAETVFSIAVMLTLKRFTTSGAREHDREHQVHVLLLGRVVEPEVHERRHEDGEAVADRRSDGHLADEVEPAREPAPAGTTELRRPVVEAAGRRVGRGDLRHRQRDDRAHQSYEQPSPRHGDRPALAECDVVRGEASRQDRNDREGDREVLKPAHRAEQLLRVAELVEGLLVLRCLDSRGCGLCAHVLACLLSPLTALFTYSEGQKSRCTRIAAC